MKFLRIFGLLTVVSVLAFGYAFAGGDGDSEEGSGGSGSVITSVLGFGTPDNQVCDGTYCYYCDDNGCYVCDDPASNPTPVCRSYCANDEYGAPGETCSSCSNYNSNYALSVRPYNRAAQYCFRNCGTCNTISDSTWAAYFGSTMSQYFSAELFARDPKSPQLPELLLLNGNGCDMGTNYCTYNVSCETTSSACKPGHVAVEFRDANNNLIKTLYTVNRSAWSTQNTQVTPNPGFYSDIVYPTFVTPTAPTISGKNFLGWYDAQTGGNQVIAPASNGAMYGDLTFNLANTYVAGTPRTLYAQYEDVVHTINLLPNGGSPTNTIYHKGNGFYCDANTTIQITSGQNIFTRCNLTKPSLSNNEFTGYWASTSGGTKYIDSDGKILSAASGVNFDGEGGTRWYAQYQSTTITVKCDCGYYVPANSTTCAPCPVGSYCPYGEWQVPVNYDQGNVDCAKICPGATSDGGACSITQCYQTCNKECYYPNELCPDYNANLNTSSCQYGTTMVDGVKYLQNDGTCGTVCDYVNQPANSAPNWCPITSCPKDYYFEEKDCKACNTGFSAPAGSTGPQQCVKNCSVACSWNASVCPAHATCTPDMTSNPNNGVVNQTQNPNACFDENTGQQLEANACDFTFACVTGYQTNELHDACEAKKYTVTYVCGDGATGSSVTDNNATYDANYTVLGNTTCTKTGHDFNGWVFSGNNNSYSAGDQFAWNYDDNTLTFTAQWGQPKTYPIAYEFNGGNWGTATCPGTGCPNSYTYGESDVIINVQPVRALSVFEGWCTDSTLTTCASSQTISANMTGNKTFYAKWRCIEPYHESTDHQSCEACLDDYYWNGATGQCLRCADADASFPHSTRPFNWSVDQCWRSCVNNASCQLAPASVIQDMNATCTATSFMSAAGTQIEFKGNAGSVITCNATNVPYCPYGFECSAENVEMPRTAPVTFHWGEGLSNSALRHVVGLGRITATGPIMTQGKMWSAIMGPAQQVEFQVAYDAYTFITYPTNAAPDAPFAGHTFVGYYDAQTGGNQHVADTGLLNGTNAQSVGVTLDNEIPGNRDLYAHYDESVYNITYVMNGGDWPAVSNCPGASGCPTTYTYGTGATINAVPTRDYSVFEAWCTDPDLNPNSCNMTQIIGPTETGNKTFYAKWKCLEPYHSNSAGTACEACGNNTYYNPESPTLCDPCPSDFPYSRTPFNWSEDQCYRDCPDGSMCQADANVGAGFPTGCNFTTFSNSGKQVEFKGNVGHVNTCGVVTYCPYGTYGCGMAEAFKPMSAPVDFYGRGNTATPVDTYYIFGSRNPNSIDLGTGNIWSQIVGPAQQGALNHNTIGGVPVDYRYTYMFYPVYTAPNADIPGYTFNGYYYPENNGTRYVQSSYALNSTNAQDVVDDVPGNWNTARPLYATLTNGGYTPIDYTITYNCGTATGGSTPAQQTGINYGDSVTPRANTCVNAGYTFLGWMVSNTSDIKQPGVAFTWEYEESKTFTAKWSGGNSYTITYKPNYTGATEADQTQDVVYGDEFTTKPAGTFHRDGYQMTAWSDPFPILNHSYNYDVAGNTTLNAQWAICVANTYSNGVICDDCPPEYPLSAQGSTIDGCYHNCETPCVEPATCPIEHATCTYGANSNPGQWYYNASACNAPALTCPVASFICDEGYTQNGDHCEPCPAGTYWENGQCVPCPEGTTSNPGSVGPDSCVPLCPNPNQHFIHGNCEDDVVSCTAPHATTATRTWNATLRAYGSCQIVECESGYHIASNACVPDEQLCNIANGRGERAWNGITWGACEITQCDPGFEESGNECVRCSNFLGSDGQPAVSSYVSGCDIATCMYQGQKYALENNECRPICEDDSDDTGSKHWDGTKCVRTCNPGYKMW